MAGLLLVGEVLTRISLILIGMVETFEGRVRIGAVIRATRAKLLVVVLTLLRCIIVPIRWSSVIEGFMRINAVIPIVIF